MAHHKSAVKRIRLSETRKQRNRVLRKKLHTLTKAVLNAESKEQAQSALQPLTSYLDQLAAKGIIHKNKAANRKSRLTRHVNKM